MTAVPNIVPLPQSSPAPHGPDVAFRAEQALIARLLSMGKSANTAFAGVSDILPSYFGSEAHALIWHGFKALVAEKTPISPLALQARLDKKIGKTDTTALEKVGVAYLHDLIGLPTTSALTDAARVVREYGVKRRGLEVVKQIERDMASLPPQQALSKAMDHLRDFSQHVSGLDGHAGQSLAVGAKTAVDALKERQKAYLAGEVTGPFMSTGYREMDALLGGGLYRGEMTLLMADPSVGKSSLALNIALKAFDQDQRVVFIPLEMIVEKMLTRALSIISGVGSTAIRTGRVGDDQLELLMEISERLSQAEAARLFHFLTFDAMPTINTVSTKLHQYVSMHGVDLIVLDQLSPEALSPVKPGIPLHEWISTATSVARGWATTYNCHVLAPAQLAKGREQRANPIPTLKDGAASYGTGRTPDNVIAMWRENETDDPPAVETINFKLLKQRDGAIGSWQLEHIRHLTRFINKGDARE